MYDVTIIGGGIIGLATGHSLLSQNPGLKILILEKESQIGQHQTGHNSGVIHSGIYYKPNSLKAINCRNGIDLLLKFCEQNNIPYDMCGKVIVATKEDQFGTLEMLYNRGISNGIKGIKKLSSYELREYEHYASGLSALYCPETGIVDYKQVCLKLSDNIHKKGEVLTDSSVINIVNKSDCITVIAENKSNRNGAEIL